MKKGIWNKRMPTLFGLLSLVLFVGAAAWFGSYYTQVRSRASGGETPNNIQVSNITDTSFTVSYTTEAKTTGVVIYGRDTNLVQNALDDRDRELGTPGQYQVHFVTIDNLEAGTKYYFAIKSGAENFLNGSNPYEAATALSLENTSGGGYQITGTVNMPDGNIPLEGIVTVFAGASEGERNSQLLSGLLWADGSYSLGLAAMMTKELNAYLEFNPGTIIHAAITNGGAQSSAVLLASQANPVPLITLSKNYDFRSGIFHSIDDPLATESGTASDSGQLIPEASPSAFPVFDTTAASEPDILIPKQGESFEDRQPMFQGTAIPSAFVNITVGLTPPLTTTVQADELGNWQFRPADPIAPGNYLFTIVTNDQQGAPKTIARNFTVFAEGSQFTEPSVSPAVIPTVIASPTATIMPTQIPTVAPTISPTGVPELTLTMAAALSLTPDPASLTAAALSMTPDPESLTITAAARGEGGSIAPAGNYSLVLAGAIMTLFIAGGLVLFFL